MKYYKWTKGVQLRGNVDRLVCWAAENGLGQEATNHLSKLSTLTDLLATPKPQLIKVRL